MAVVIAAPPALSGDLTLFYTTDPLLSNLPLFVFYGPAATIGATSSRIQIHIFSAAGHASYPRLAISPNAPFYSAVSNLPREEQGDENCRGLAFGLKKYFSELSEQVRQTWCAETKAVSPAALFGDEHVAILATRMIEVNNSDIVTEQLLHAFEEKRISWMDVDFVLPPGSIKEVSRSSDAATEDEQNVRYMRQRYGRYAGLVASLGETAFLPTSKMKRAPSKASQVGRMPSFLSHQKENVAKEIRELVETEENYVQRVTELFSLSQNLGSNLDLDRRETLRQVFPGSLATIVERNGQMLERLIEEVQDGSAQDVICQPRTPLEDTTAANAVKDNATHVLAVAKILREWIPKLRDSYVEYIKAHIECASILRELIKSTDTCITNALHEVGEQKLHSLLIEPVQRLPRYTLYIDTIVKQLPVRHPAIERLLKARDLVSEICDQGGSTTSGSDIVKKLRAHVSDWPHAYEPAGRLVTACDFTEVSPPFQSQACDGQQGLLLVFTDTLVLLDKCGKDTINARALMTEIETGRAPVQTAQSRSGTPSELRFKTHILLHTLECLECRDGQTLQIFPRTVQDLANMSRTSSAYDRVQYLRLEGAYERKIERLTEEIAKAQLENRFTEGERESAKWELRLSDPAGDSASLFCAIFEDSHQDHVAARNHTSSIRITVDIDRHSQKPRAGSNGLRTVVCVTPLRDDNWRVTFDSVDGRFNQEQIPTLNVLPVIRKKLGLLMAARLSIDHPDSTACLLGNNANMLHSIYAQLNRSESGIERQASNSSKSHKPISPRKLLSSFLSNPGVSVHTTGNMKKDLPSLPPPSQMEPPLNRSKPPSRDSRPTSKDQPSQTMSRLELYPRNLLPAHQKLEETLRAYVLALEARKGNIVGRNVKMRSAANELAVNELYNCLLEDPAMMVQAAQASVDVLFAAFEKFLNNAWKDGVGQVLPLSLLQEVQTKAETLFPSNFDQYLREVLDTLSPPNQRAFKTIVKLLAELLDGTGNDSDRGILTATFAELLVPDGNALDFVALFDRFVDDPDTYFGEPLDEVQRVNEGLNQMHKRSRSVNSASISSNASSLRKKFGFGGLTRENSRSEQESKVASVWRTLSKSARGDVSPVNSIAKGSLYRSQSTDVDGRSIISRPTSQDGSIFKNNGFGDEHSFTSNASMHSLGLATIGEHPSFVPAQPPRKKRRSSLSDLVALDSMTKKSPLWTPNIARRPLPAQRYADDISSANSPSASSPPSKTGSARITTSASEIPRAMLPPPFRKENSPGPMKALNADHANQRPQPSGEAIVAARQPSNIPALSSNAGIQHRGPAALPGQGMGLFERRDAGNVMRKSSRSPSPDKKPRSMVTTTETGSPKKLRMQSPQKLRERLYHEQSALNDTQTDLQDELSKISNELTSPTPVRAGSVRKGPFTNSRGGHMDLAARVLKMEAQLQQHMDDLSARISSIQSDLATSLTVSETKNKRLDELYREANGENEALYARFNDELGRILKAVRGGDGVNELKTQLKESQEEAAKLKRENGRLKRENLGLRSQLKE